MLGLHCCVWVFSSCGYSGCGAQASHWGDFSWCRARAVGQVGFSRGVQASLPHGMWGLPSPGIESVSPTLASRFLTTGPQGKSNNVIFVCDGILFFFWLPPPQPFEPHKNHFSSQVTAGSGQNLDSWCDWSVLSETWLALCLLAPLGCPPPTLLFLCSPVPTGGLVVESSCPNVG